MPLKMKRWWRRKIRSRASSAEAFVGEGTSTTAVSNSTGAGGVMGTATVLTVDNYGRSNSSPASSSAAGGADVTSSSRTNGTRTRRIFRSVRQGDGRRAYSFTTAMNNGATSGGEIDELEGGLMLEMFLQSLMRSENGRGRRGRGNAHFIGNIMEDIDNMSYERLLELFGDGSENKGADEWSIKALPSFVVEDVDKELSHNSKQCMICLEDIQKGDKLKTLPCSHAFHAACCDKWLSINASCPVCKYCIKV
mmetsp:Transcript_18946/g.26089  ORF Transcript_18946/g.26089 Transcript_18946/m.26089 type:complete len:251 (-) Transcript_18946:151-903(-)|eukprot:CAMPEP_0185736116 /NCGR_PEP_ID=MMETSP1171-20130828/26944_1 /TAXON_ID=374046 /ORGANISM="Helicotheca tamensis, Strain CCMP826" /LENGTH=250 /DNA_ID=CAMNT_0028406627 /DNA_START=200 /DNA_END=952 /DNA_ORIENTATION=-